VLHHVGGRVHIGHGQKAPPNSQPEEVLASIGRAFSPLLHLAHQSCISLTGLAQILMFAVILEHHEIAEKMKSAALPHFNDEVTATSPEPSNA
jgi:hypothetical protein